MNTEYEVRDLANELMTKHGLIAIGWRLGFDSAKRRCGLCSYRKKVISLSVYTCFRMPLSEVEDTIKHEIAHALVGPGHNHDWVWKAKAREIGAKPDRCSSIEVERPTGKYVAHCSCSTHYLYRRPKYDLSSYRCAKCRQKLEFTPTGL
jgi:predicted SprT family Zn-dependent metalloprotease